MQFSRQVAESSLGPGVRLPQIMALTLTGRVSLSKLLYVSELQFLHPENGKIALPTVLVSYCCCNKIITKLEAENNTSVVSYSSIVWSPPQVSGLKSRCQQGCLPSGGSRGEVFLAFPASRGPSHSLAHGPFPPSSKPAT